MKFHLINVLQVISARLVPNLNFLFLVLKVNIKIKKVRALVLPVLRVSTA